jgi:hypothetical protein
VHGNIVDINAFAPRDYVKIKKEKKKATVNITYDKDPNDKFDGWYERFENNGWRPVITILYFSYFFLINRLVTKS